MSLTYFDSDPGDENDYLEAVQPFDPELAICHPLLCCSELQRLGLENAEQEAKATARIIPHWKRAAYKN